MLQRTARGPSSPNRGLPTQAVSCANSEQFLEARHAGAMFGKRAARNSHRPAVSELSAGRLCPLPSTGTPLVPLSTPLQFLAREAPKTDLRREWTRMRNVPHVSLACLALPGITLPHQTRPYLATPRQAQPHHATPHLASPYPAWPDLAFPRLAS